MGLKVVSCKCGWEAKASPGKIEAIYCPQCGRKVPIEQEMFTCDECGEKFVTKKGLTVHKSRWCEG